MVSCSTAKDVNYGYDAQKGEFTDLVQTGMIDRTKVVRHALQDAASVAGLHEVGELALLRVGAVVDVLCCRAAYQARSTRGALGTAPIAGVFRIDRAATAISRETLGLPKTIAIDFETGVPLTSIAVPVVQQSVPPLPRHAHAER